jgi:hypothetical protein
MPAYLPAALLRHVPLLPLDRDFVVPLVHTDDVADALARALELFDSHTWLARVLSWLALLARSWCSDRRSPCCDDRTQGRR